MFIFMIPTTKRLPRSEWNETGRQNAKELKSECEGKGTKQWKGNIITGVRNKSCEIYKIIAHFTCKEIDSDRY